MKTTLISFDKLSNEQLKEISIKGGKASGKVRRAKAERRDQLVELMYDQALKDSIADEVMQAISIVRSRQKHRKKDREHKRRKRANTT